jgi:heme/copper-type cytochrome/quinol oxidase subunit 2
MIIMLIVIYLVGWLVATCAAYAASRRLAEPDASPLHPLMVGVAAGAVWPLLVVGLIELSSIVVLTRVQPKPASNMGILV